MSFDLKEIFGGVFDSLKRDFEHDPDNKLFLAKQGVAYKLGLKSKAFANILEKFFRDNNLPLDESAIVASEKENPKSLTDVTFNEDGSIKNIVIYKNAFPKRESEGLLEHNNIDADFALLGGELETKLEPYFTDYLFPNKLIPPHILEKVRQTTDYGFFVDLYEGASLPQLKGASQMLSGGTFGGLSSMFSGHSNNETETDFALTSNNDIPPVNWDFTDNEVSDMANSPGIGGFLSNLIAGVMPVLQTLWSVVSGLFSSIFGNQLGGFGNILAQAGNDAAPPEEPGNQFAAYDNVLG